jgi:hypothetical protein
MPRQAQQRGRVACLDGGAAVTLESIYEKNDVFCDMLAKCNVFVLQHAHKYGSRRFFARDFDLIDCLQLIVCLVPKSLEYSSAYTCTRLCS